MPDRFCAAPAEPFRTQILQRQMLARQTLQLVSDLLGAAGSKRFSAQQNVESNPESRLGEAGSVEDIQNDGIERLTLEQGCSVRERQLLPLHTRCRRVISRIFRLVGQVLVKLKLPGSRSNRDVELSARQARLFEPRSFSFSEDGLQGRILQDVQC